MEQRISFDSLPEAVTLLKGEIAELKGLILSHKEPQPEADQLFTIQQAGQLLNLSVPTLYGLVQRSAIPVSKRGKRLYFSKFELMDWVKQGRKKTLAEIKIEADNYLSVGKRKGGKL